MSKYFLLELSLLAARVTIIYYAYKKPISIRILEHEEISTLQQDMRSSWKLNLDIWRLGKTSVLQILAANFDYLLQKILEAWNIFSC